MITDTMITADRSFLCPTSSVSFVPSVTLQRPVSFERSRSQSMTEGKKRVLEFEHLQETHCRSNPVGDYNTTQFPSCYYYYYFFLILYLFIAFKTSIARFLNYGQKRFAQVKKRKKKRKTWVLYFFTSAHAALLWCQIFSRRLKDRPSICS